MKTDFYLIYKYWKFNKKQLIKVLSAIVFLVATLSVSVLMERTQLRRQYDSLLCEFGAYTFAFDDVSDDSYSQLANEDEVEKIGKISVFGRLGNDNTGYAFGAYDSQAAKELDYLKLKSGRLPENSGEAAVYDYVLEQLYFTDNTDDFLNTEITLSQYDFDGVKTGDKTIKIVGIIESYKNRSLTEFSEYWAMDADIPMPSFILPFEDCANLESVSNYALVKIKNSEILSEENNERYLEFRQKCADDYDIFVCEYGGITNAAESVMSYQAGNQLYSAIYRSDSMMVIRYFSMATIVLSAISLFGVLYSVMEKRVKSLDCAKMLGYSKRRVARLLATESIILFIVGFAVGIICSVAVYELILVIQNAISDLPILRAYSAEWAVNQITQKPFAYALMPSAVAFFAGYLLYLLSALIKARQKRKTSKKLRSFFAIKLRLAGSTFTNIIHIVSFAIVTFSITAFYAFFTSNGKGADNEYITSASDFGDSYFQYANINMKEQDIDCCIYTSGGSGAIGPMIENNNGISLEALDKIENIDGIEETLAYSINLAANIIYPKDSEDIPPFVLHNLKVDFTQGMETMYGTQGLDCYQLTMVMGNKSATQALSEYVTSGKIGQYENGVTIVLYEEDGIDSPYTVGDEIPMMAICSDLDNVSVKAKNEYSVIVEAIAVIPFSASEDDEILYSAYKTFQGIAMAITCDTSLETYKNCYDFTYIKMAENADSNAIIKEVRSNITPSMNAKLQTLEECQREYLKGKIEQYMSTVLVFAVLVIIIIVGFANLVDMKIQSGTKNSAIMRAIGLTKKKSKAMFMMNNVINTLLGCAVGSAVAFGAKNFIEKKYNEVISLYEKAGGTAGNIDFEIYAKAQDIEHNYLLNYQMHKAPILLALIAVCIALVAVTVAVVAICTKAQCNYNISDEISKATKE